MNPDQKTRFEKAFGLHRDKKMSDAVAIYRELIGEDLTDPDLLHLFGLALHQLGHHKKALALLQQAVAAAPGSAVFRSNLAIVHRALGDFEKAAAEYLEVIEIEPNNLEARRNLTFHLRKLRRHEEALEHGKRALEIAPDHSATWNNLGNIYNDLGHIEKAHHHYGKSIEISPEYGQAWANLATVRQYTFKDKAEIETMKQLHHSNTLKAEDARHIGFAIGKAYKDLGEAEQAFAYFSKSKKQIGTNFPWEKYESYLSNVRKTFKRSFFNELDELGIKQSSESPIFIVGMLRSGTSLTEQILSAHSKISGVGERPELPRLTYEINDYPNGITQLDLDRYFSIAAEYTKSISEFVQPGCRSADKMMTNFMHIGLINVLFPNAKIIHMVRNPYAVGLSIFFQNFATPPGWASSLDDIGRYHASYQTMMKHWERHSPIDIHTVAYEDLLEDPESVARDMVEYCGEEWELECLEYYKNRNVVQTASNWQVRQPIKQDNGDKWKEYAPYLGALDRWVS